MFLSLIHISKEAILEAALHKNPVFFWIGAGVALLTTFYMMRVIFVRCV